MSTYDPNHIHTETFFIIGQKAVIFNSEGKILVLLRSEKSGNGGKWSLAGGQLEIGETLKEGLKREFFELYSEYGNLPAPSRNSSTHFQC